MFRPSRSSLGPPGNQIHELFSLSTMWDPKCSQISVTEENVYSLYKLNLLCDAFNPLTPNDPYSGRTAPLTSKRCVLYIYSTNTGTEYVIHGIYSSGFPPPLSKCSLFHNSNVFGSCCIHIFYTECAKI